MINVAIDQESPFRELNIKNRRVMVSISFLCSDFCGFGLCLSSRGFCVGVGFDTKERGAGRRRRRAGGGGEVAAVAAATAVDALFRAMQAARRLPQERKVLDITGVQTYIINSARVVFLNERPQPRPGKGVTNTCEVCNRSLLDSFRFCSLGCKVSASPFFIAGTASDYSRNRKKSKKKKKKKSTAGSDSEASETSASSGSDKCQDGTQSFTPSTPSPTAARLRSSNRRKGIPHRAPFGSLMLEF
ncbi:hypothetical protein GW17_00048592 [Ensete ventricosum]|nr:hypothetical protein GW17_00048592 [Ensete ventricosum]